MADNTDNNFDDNLIEDDDFPEVIDDNFNDDISFDEDDFESVEETESFDEFDDTGYTNPPQKNGANWFNIGIIGAVILAIGGITYSLFPGLVGGQKLVPQQVQNNPAPVVEKTSQAEPEVSFFSDPELLNDSVEQIKTNDTQQVEDIFNPFDSATPSISDSEIDNLFETIPLAETNMPSPPEDYNNAPVAPQNIVTLPMPSDANPITIDDDLTFDPEVIEIAVEQPVALTTAPSTEIEQINARIDSMNIQIESFMNRLESKLENMSVPAPQTVTVDNSDQINALQQSISQLESRLNAMAEQPKPQIEIAPSPAPVVAIAEEPKPNVMIEEKAPDVLLPTPSPTKTVSAPKRREPAYVPPKMTYELRGASNGQAVIAQKGTQNLQMVSVGMVIRGLGTIRSIAVENGVWVVRGTSGTVRQ